jgi:hypothetical protein
MMKRNTLILLFLLLLPVSIVAGQATSPNFDNQRSVIISSGTATSANFRVRGTVGQPATNRSSSPNYRVLNGFYFGGDGVPTAVGMGADSTKTTVIPFTLLIALASTLITIAVVLRRRSL